MMMFYEKQKECILSQLAVKGEMGGAELVKGSNGIVKMGSVYVVLGQLYDEGLVEKRFADLDAPWPQSLRRLFKITDQGRRKMIRSGESSTKGWFSPGEPAPV